MSRVIQDIATVQFQVNARQANGAMQALQKEADDLARKMADVNKGIASLGKDVPKDNPRLKELTAQLNDYDKALRDVQKAQRELVKGAKAADQLWKAAMEGNIESLSFRSIKAGQNGLRKRQEGLSPGDAQDMKDWRIIKEVIDEADRVMKQAGADVQNVVQTIREGGKVSEQAMRQTISTLKELKGSVDETDADFRTYGNDLDFMEAKLQEFNEAQRRARGEIVDANDARREMNKLTAEGAAAAKREAEEADRLVQSYQKEGEELQRKRNEIKANIEDTQKQIDENHKLIEEKHRQLAADEETFQAEQQSRRTTIDGLKQQAEAERKLANEKSDAAETHRRAAELQAQTTEQLTEKVTELQGKLAELNAEPVKPKVDTSEIERLNAELKEAQRVLGNASAFEKLAQAKLEGMRSAYSREESLFNEKRDRLRKFTDSTYELQERKNELEWAIEPFSGRHRQGYNHFDVHDVEQQRVAVEKLDEAFRRLHDDEYFKNASLSRQYELLGTAAFGHSDAERQFGSYERAIRSLGVALEETGAKFRLTFQGAGVDKSFQGVEFLEGYVSRRKELAQLNSDIKKALGDTDIDALAREVEAEAGILRKSSEELKEQEREVERWGRLKEEYAGKAAEAERLYNEAQAQTTQGAKSEAEALVAAKQKQVDAIKAGTKATAESNEKSEEELRLKGELEETQGKLAESKQRENEEQQEYVKLQGEAIEQGNKAADIEAKLTAEQSKATQKQVEFNQTQQEGLEAINQIAQGNQTLQQSIDGLNGELEQNSKDIADNANKASEAEQKKQQAQQLTIKRMEEMIAVLRKENNEVIPANTEEWRKNEAEINSLTASLEKMKEAARIDQIKVKGAEAMSFFNDKNVISGVYSESNLIFKTKADSASAAETAEQVKALQAYRDVLPKDTDAATIERIDEILREQAKLLKETTGEWMTYDDAVELASKAGGEGFLATTQQMQKAVQAMERQRDSLIETIQLKKKNGQATADEEAQLETLEKELKDLKFEQDNFNMSHEKMQRLLEEPTKATDLDELKAAIKRADGELHRMKQSLGENNEEYQEFAAKVKGAKNVLKEMEGQAKATSSAFEKAWSRLKTYITLYVSAAAAIQKIIGTFGDLMELSDKMGEVRKTTGFTADEVGRLSESLKKLDTRTTITGLLDLSVAAGQLGLKTQEDVEGFTIAANKLMVALPEMGKEGATEMLKVALATGEIDKIRRQMEQGLIDGSSATAVAMEKVGSTIDRLRATSAATAPAITDFVKRVGAVGSQSGISIDQVAALGSTVDALGMRVEMSATALSRMLPAIKNNAFDLAKILGVTPNTIRELYDTGRGMEVILMIFQHIKDAGMDADSIEGMLGMGNMKEIMKELNQQGARAGIVFGGLSQNVDELRRQLGVAAQAYKENTAIQNEYNKMNDTTAAKWERLKNQFEEFFVGDFSQRMLGGFIDGLRKLVNFITGDVDPALQTLRIIVLSLAAAWATFKIGLGEALFVSSRKAIVGLIDSLKILYLDTQKYIALQWQLARAHDATEKAAIKAKLANNALNASMKANLIMAVVAAVAALGFALYRLWQESKEAAAEVGRFNQKIAEEQQAMNSLFVSLKNTNVTYDERSKLISEINEKYGKYLGYMLSETATAEQLAEAHALIAKRIREEALEQRKAELERKVYEKHDEDVNAAYGEVESAVREGAKGGADIQAITDLLKKIVDENIEKENYDVIRDKLTGLKVYTTNPEFDRQVSDYLERLVLDGKLSKDNVSDVKQALLGYAHTSAVQHDEIMEKTAGVRSDLRGIQGAIQFDLTSNLSRLVGNIIEFGNQQPRTYGYTPELTGEQNPPLDITKPPLPKTQKTFPWLTSSGTGTSKVPTVPKTQKTFPWLTSSGTGTSKVPTVPTGWTPRVNENNLSEVKQFVQNQDNLRSFLANNPTGISAADRANAERLLVSNDELERLRKKIPNAPATTTTGGGGGGGGRSVWGSNAPAESTDYSLFDVNELVARRNQMDKFKNVLKTDTDFKKVLAEDAALMKAIREGKVKETRESILAWYNQERLKIQEELHSERFSTNEGHWRDEKTKKGRRRRNLFAESDYALAELDRYYSRRKETLEKARISENMSEELFNRQAELLEQEHLERRNKLRQTFTGTLSKEETEAFRKWWAQLSDEEVHELEKVPWDVVEREWAAATAAQIGRNNLRAQKDLTDLQQITVKHLNKIADLVAKERPYDGIVNNLRKNLTDMDILFADLEKKGVTEPAKLVQAAAERMRFLLTESENAYALTFDDLAEKMRENGMGDWADELMIDEQKRQSIIEALHKTYDDVQNAIKKESTQIKKNVDIMWQDVLPGQKMSLKDSYEMTIAALGLEESKVSRANSLISAGQASERVADKLAIQQMKLKITMQEHYYNLMEQEGQKRIAFLKDEEQRQKRIADQLKRQAEELKEEGKLEEANLASRRAEEALTKSTEAALDAQHLTTSLNISQSKELLEIEKQREEIIARTEESENRLYKELKEWGDLLTSSVKDLFEASHAGEEEYYNSLAMYNLTGKGGPGAGTYIVTENAGKEGATAHYEYLDELQAIERQREIERQNAQAEAWKKVMDDINQKLSETITDQLNAMLQNQSIDLNTKAVDTNTVAITGLTEQLAQGINVNTQSTDGTSDAAPARKFDENDPDTWPRAMRKRAGLPVDENPFDHTQDTHTVDTPSLPVDTSSLEALTDASDAAAQKTVANNQKMQKSTQSTFAKMTMAANMYGIAYQTMSNDNLSATQKFEMMALQAVGNYAIGALTTEMASASAKATTDSPGVLGTLWKQLGWAAAPVFAIFTGLLGGLMGIATSKISKAKSQIAQATGASASAGKLTTGMLAYAEGNVNEFSDPDSLTEGRMYNVDAADGRTYRARYIGRNPKTHLTNGPEFHLSGERGREMIIDAGTTRQITMNDGEIWRSIQTLSAGGRLPSARRRRGRGVAAFAEGNVEDFEEMSGYDAANSTGMDFTAIQDSLDRNSAIQEALLERLNEPIVAQNILYGPNGLPNIINKLQEEAKRHGEKYL